MPVCQHPPTPTYDPAIVSPVQYNAERRPLAYHWPAPLQQNMYHPMMTNVAPIYPSMLPYMMPLQHNYNPVMFNPMMYQ